jgi:hypothetical protein
VLARACSEAYAGSVNLARRRLEHVWVVHGGIAPSQKITVKVGAIVRAVKVPRSDVKCLRTPEVKSFEVKNGLQSY